MSNLLVISVTKFQLVNEEAEPSFGFTASDNYGKTYANHYDSYEEFKEEFPTQDDLILHVLELSEFEDGATVTEDGQYELDSFSAVTVLGYV